MNEWTQRVRHLADRVEGINLPEAISGFLKDHATGKQPLLVACSGGADSVFLVLYLLAKLPPDWARSVHLLHYNHGIRGTESDADAEFVRMMAHGLDLAVSIREAQGLPDRSEDSLRMARYDWMTTVYRSVGAAGLFLGHHADDRLESQLMALFSGAGPAGLAAPLPVKSFPDGHVRLRPLLGFTRSRIETILQSAGIPWREDSSNTDTAYTRNWIRHHLLPELEAAFPQDVRAGSRRTAQLMAEVVTFLDDQVRGLGLDTDNAGSFEFSPLRGQPRALVRRAFMGWWLRHYPDERISAAAIENVLDGIIGNSPVSSVPISPAHTLLIDEGGLLTLATRADARPLGWSANLTWSPLAGPAFLPDGSQLRGQLIKQPAKDTYGLADPAEEAWLNTTGETLRVRNWQPGDRYRPLGAPGSRKIQDCFTDRKIPLEQKHRLPVITTTNGKILWVPGFPPAQDACLEPGDKMALKLTYVGQSAGF